MATFRAFQNIGHPHLPIAEIPRNESVAQSCMLGAKEEDLLKFVCRLFSNAEGSLVSDVAVTGDAVGRRWVCWNFWLHRSNPPLANILGD